MTRDHVQVVAAAFTRQATSFNASTVANSAEFVDAIMRHARPRAGERWLEAACGPGVISRTLALTAGTVHGIDATGAMVDLARREAAGAGLTNVTFEVGDATATSLKDGSFDGALTRFSVHHIPVPARLLCELARVVRPGGTVAVLDHLADPDPESRAWAQEIERLRDPSHWASLSADGLRELGRKARLTLVHEQTFAFELDFDDWLQRGTDDEAARDLVELSIASRPAGTDYFCVERRPSGRILRLQMWLGVWRR